MIIHKQLECPVCGLLQKAEIYSVGEDIRNAKVENIMFTICKHYIFSNQLIRELLAFKTHPKEKSIYELNPWPPVGKLYSSSNYHSGMGKIVSESTWIWFHEGINATNYVLTKDETNKIYTMQRVLI